MKKVFFDKLTLNFTQSLIIGNHPDLVSPENIVKRLSDNKTDLESFGFFDSNNSNFNNYYPDVKPEDFVVKDSDLIKPIFRMLSEVIVNKKSNPVDFSKNGVLKSSMSKLLGQSVYPNHDASVGNEVGSVAKVFWQESYTTNSGVKVPAGINAELAIDAKSNPKLARAINMTPPAVHSNSVTVGFQWEPSHSFKSEDDFWRNLGAIGPDKNLIRRIATNILLYNETSLVRHGADPFAQKIGDAGKIINPEYAKSVYSLAYEEKEKPKHFYFSYKEDLINLEETEFKQFEETIPTIPNNKSKVKMREILLAMAMTVALSFKDPNADEATLQAEFEAHIKSLKLQADAQPNNDALLRAEKDKVTALTSEVTTLKAGTTLQTVGETALKALRDDTKRVYGIIKKDKQDATVLTTLENADFASLTAFNKDYTEQLEAAFPLECSSCHSTTVSRRVSVPGNPEQKSIKSFTETVDLMVKAKKAKFILDQSPAK